MKHTESNISIAFRNFLSNNGALYIGVVLTIGSFALLLTANSSGIQGRLLKATNTVPQVSLEKDCTNLVFNVFDADVRNPENMVVDIYIDSYADQTTRFSRFNAQEISINPHDYQSLFPTDQETHMLYVWVKDFNSVGQAVGSVNGWELVYEEAWDRSACSVTNVEPVAYVERLDCNEAFVRVSDTDLRNPDEYEVDVYLDSDIDHSTRFDRFFTNEIVITPREYRELFPRDGEHSLIVWIKDKNSYGLPVADGAEGWVMAEPFEWNTSMCAMKELSL